MLCFAVLAFPHRHTVTSGRAPMGRYKMIEHGRIVWAGSALLSFVWKCPGHANFHRELTPHLGGKIVCMRVLHNWKCLCVPISKIDSSRSRQSRCRRSRRRRTGGLHDAVIGGWRGGGPAAQSSVLSFDPTTASPRARSRRPSPFGRGGPSILNGRSPALIVAFPWRPWGSQRQLLA